VIFRKGYVMKKNVWGLGLQFTVYDRTFLSIADAPTHHVLPQISKYMGCVDI